MIIDKNLPKSIKVIGIINIIIGAIVLLIGICSVLTTLFDKSPDPLGMGIISIIGSVPFFIGGSILLVFAIFLLKKNNSARVLFGVFTIIISILLFLGLIGFASDLIANIQSGGNKAVLAPDQASLPGSIMNFIMFLLPLIFHIIEFYFLLINKKIRAAFKNK